MKRARTLREEAGLSQEDIAQAIGVDRSAIAHFEKRDKAFMRADRLEKFAEILAEKLGRPVTSKELYEIEVAA